MTIRDDARQEAERRWPALNPDAEELTYPRSAIRRMTREAFVAGAVWRDGQIDRGCGHPNHGVEDHDCAPFLPDREPSDAEVEAAARKVWHWFVGSSLDGFDKPAYTYDREKCVDAARAALLAAQAVRHAD